ncbi:hypothetical protein CEK26_009086 [Fusarium fujikuroi]|nr:hypothetical protein CEK27_009104 [Fusarium fujikuroi]QGI82386.1 hypothetical protein CEK25_009115 [Fusarium fujikuroi]QGI96017.1 hypothetical protein CEK26_009086 [Fusarium fujikuroi]
MVQHPLPDSLISMDEAMNYWQNVSASVDGMLGGFPSVSRIDLQGSRSFLAKLGIGKPRVPRALEGGAGIGRITKGLLLDVAETVDIIEPVAKFTAALVDTPGVGQIHNIGLQDWQLQDIQYDLIWTQWCAGQIPDVLLIQYLERCASALAPLGIIVVKENLSTSGEDTYDKVDSSVTRNHADGEIRTDEGFRAIFEKAGLEIIQAELQKGFPKSLLPVKMYALKPKGQ